MIYPECCGACQFSVGSCKGKLLLVIGTARSGVLLMGGEPVYYCEGTIKREEAIGYTFEIVKEQSIVKDINSKACNCDMFIIMSTGCQCGGK